MLKAYICLCLCLCLPVILSAQTKISGTVTNNRKQPLAGANIYIKGAYDGATSGKDGKYGFTTTENGKVILVASFQDYQSIELELELTGAPLVQPIVLKKGANELKMVTISASSFEAGDKKKNPVLTPLDIVSTAGANADIVGALKTLPGTQQVGEQTGLFVRGGTGYETQTFIDGMLVRNPFYSGMPDLATRGRFSPFLFKGTTFSSGGYSAQYGQGLSSALILETEDLPDRSSSTLNLSTVGIGGGISKLAKNKKSSYGLEADYFNLTPYYKIVPQKNEPSTYPSGLNTTANFRVKTSKSGILKFYGTYAYNTFGYIKNSIEYPKAKEEFSLKNGNVYTNMSYRERLNENWKLDMGVSYSTNNDNIKMDTFANEIPTTKVHNNSQLLQFRPMISRNIGFTTLRLGMEYQYATEKVVYNGDELTYHDQYTAAFAEGDVYITPRLVSRMGARFEYSSILAKTNIAPRVSLAYRLSGDGQVSLAYGEYYQKPEPQYIRFNPNMDYMRATHYIASYQKVASLHTFRVEAFYKKYHDLVKTVPDLNNDGKGYASGVELFYRDKKTIHNGDFWISYSYLNTKRDYLNYPAEVQPDFAANHTASLVYKQFIPSITTYLGMTYSFATGRPYYDPNKPESEFLKDRTKAFNTMGLSVIHTTSIGKAFTVLVASVTNVLGTEQVYGYRYSSDGLRRDAVGPLAPRFFFLGMFMSFGIDRSKDIIDNN
ncbi:TonB-dependent receptor [Chitinophaga caeni]|uniref:TonB-dependent receptor n=1 Tax=Chitinophaga caeni TaxID=2029983 RepID=A0A291QT88_9BACT|nr:TonB-dependent receptor [Chitinophaga caeni]ATL47083.1 TonB-dependent receptor [Chitinophaga caeni]